MNTNDDISENAISVYGSEDASLNDFPVLKAFQQYIDAEQTKARKRMLWLSVFFGVLMIVVVSVFVLLLLNVSQKNQALNDKLVEFALQERDRQAEANKEAVKQAERQAESDTAFKALADTLSAIQKQIADQNLKQVELTKKVNERPEGPTPDQIALQNKIKEDTEKLKRATALLQAEKEKLAAKKEALRQQEIEAQRRRLYPEYYGKKDTATPSPKKVQAPKDQAKEPTKLSEMVPIDYFAEYEDEEDAGESTDEELTEMVEALPKRATSKRPSKSTVPKTTDHYGVPLKVNGSSANWLVPTK